MSSGYENAPATALIATSCAACGRPLLDAVSVEAGMGPDCRRKHGYGEPQGSADWEAAILSLAPRLDLVHAIELATAERDAHRAANILVRHVACEADLTKRAGMIGAIAALGFETLARKLAAHAGGIFVDASGETLLVKAPYSEAFNAHVRRVPGQRWDRDAKARIVPASERRALWRALQASFPPGTPVYGSKGVNVL